MCGIIGNLCKDFKKDSSIQKGLKQLTHRGPDFQNIWTDENHQISLGHARLSILDLSSNGNQPMSFKNERYWISYNGEVYNYLELKKELSNAGISFKTHTDTEIVLAAYSIWGVNCLERFRGMFAFAIWDQVNKNLFLARDRLGEKPLYYYHDQTDFYFASEIRALLTCLPQLPKLDPNSIDRYLHYQYVPEPHTPFQNILKLPPACYMVVNLKTWSIELKKYWDINQIEPIEGDPIKLIRQELERSIELTLRADVPVGIALSGGLDSSTVAILASQKSSHNLQAFSVGYPGYPRNDERKSAKMLATELKIPLHEVEIRSDEFIDFFPTFVQLLDEPIADIAAYGHYKVAQASADKGVKVLLGGLGGDELFDGYAWVQRAAQLNIKKQQILQSHNQVLKKFLSSCSFLAPIVNTPFYSRLAQYRKIPAVVQKFLHFFIDIYLLNPNTNQRGIFYDLNSDFLAVQSLSQELYTKSFNSSLKKSNAVHLFEFDIINTKDILLKTTSLLFDTWLVSNCLNLGDRVSMGASIELRSPLLDYRLAEVVLGLRKNYSNDPFANKAWLKKAMSPEMLLSVLQRPKQGFEPPVYEWINGILDKYLPQLRQGYLLKMEILDPQNLEKMVNKKRNREYCKILYKLVLLELWYRGFIE